MCVCGGGGGGGGVRGVLWEEAGQGEDSKSQCSM